MRCLFYLYSYSFACEVCLCGRLDGRIYNSMSLDGNGGKIGQTNLIIWLMLPVGVVMCMPGQYRVSPPLTAIIATRRHGIITTRRWRHSTGISAHFGDVALLEGNQWLSEHVELWRYPGSNPWNTAWEMAWMCFAKCPCRAHWRGVCRGAQGAIWHHCEKLPRRVPNHHQLGPYKSGTIAGGAHQIIDVPQIDFTLTNKPELTTHIPYYPVQYFEEARFENVFKYLPVFFPVGAWSVTAVPGSSLGCLLGGSWLYMCFLFCWCFPLFYTLFLFLLGILSILPACRNWLFRWVGCCCFFSLSSFVILFLPSMVSMSSSPISIYSASLGVDVGAILFMMLSSTWLFFFSFPFWWISLFPLHRWWLVSGRWWTASAGTFSLITYPRYWYVLLRYSSICSSVNLGHSLVSSIIIVWLFFFSKFGVVLLVMSCSFRFSLGLVSRSNDNFNDNESMFIVKVVQESKPNNQQCKYMIHHKVYRQMVKHSRVSHNFDKGGGSGDLCAPNSREQQVH